MVSKFTLLSIASLAFVALAIPPSRLGARAEDIYSHFSNRSTSSQNISPDTGNNSVVNTTLADSTLAGARCVAQGANNFVIVSATFKVPPIWSQTGQALFMVSIGVPNCGKGVLALGLYVRMLNRVATYNAVYQWFPQRIAFFPVDVIKPGDELKLTIQARDVISALVIVQNITQGWVIWIGLIYPTGDFCDSVVRWLVSAPPNSLLADFSLVTFYDAVAAGANGQRCDPSGASLSEMKRNNRALTQTSVTGNNLNVRVIWTGT